MPNVFLSSLTKFVLATALLPCFAAAAEPAASAGIHPTKAPTTRNVSVNAFFKSTAARHNPKYRFAGSSKSDFANWQKALLPAAKTTLGPMPQRVPLNAEILSEWREDGLIKQRVVFDVEQGLSAIAYVFRPENADGRLPAILCCHGHGLYGKDPVMGIRTSPELVAEIKTSNYDYGLQMAKAGFVTIAIDWRGFGERGDGRSIGGRDLCNLHYLRESILDRTVLGMDINDGMRAIDYLCEQPFVDSNRIGVMGLSFGGTMTTWMSIVDPRIKATDIICYSNRFADFGMRDVNFCGSQITPGLYELCDVPDLHGLIAPRPLLVEIGKQDLCFKIDSASSCFKEVEKIYSAAGSRDRLELDLFDGGHQWGANKSLAFFRKYLSVEQTQATSETAVSSIEQLDKNMAGAEVRDGLAWYDLKKLPLEGQGWTDVKRHFARLPGRAKGVVRSEVWTLSQMSAGMCIRFQTDSPRISARWKVLSDPLGMFHMAATGMSGIDLYGRFDGKWRWMGVGRPMKFPTNTAVLAENIPAGMREYRLYLPLYNGTEEIEIGLPPDAKLLPAPEYPQARRKPICYYGTSISQGGCASRPGMAHVAILGRRLEWPMINLGFSGNGKMDAEVVDLLAELDPAMYVIDCASNMDAKMITERVEPLVNKLRSARPKTPIMLIEAKTYADAYYSEPRRQRGLTSNAALKAGYERLLAAGVTDLHYVPTDDLIGHDSEATVDGTHPTDLGFLRMADAMEPYFRRALGLAK